MVEREVLVEEVRSLKDTLRVSQTLLPSLPHCIPSVSPSALQTQNRFKTKHTHIDTNISLLL